MTATETAVDAVDEAGALADARELAALTMLASRVKQRVDELRDVVRAWVPETKVSLILPNPDNPKSPYKVGQIRCDNGAVVARVADEAAFVAWVQQHAPTEIIESPQVCLTPDVPPVPLRNLLEQVHIAVQRRCVGPIAENPAEVMWGLLLDSGWTLCPVQYRPAETLVHPSYVKAVLEKSKKEKEAAAPNGMVPDGIAVSIADPKPYVWVTDDGALQDGFVATVRDLPLPAAAALVLED